jgi:[CysO sulfur-carrier protein]-S-L-cysteine hydrolase
MVLSREIYGQIVAHAREEAPNECCGMIATVEGRAVQAFRATNAAASPLRYVVDSGDLFRITMDIEDRGWDLGAIYHSHTRSEPYPSQTDINLALNSDKEQNYPGTLYVIVGVANPEEPEVRAFDISAAGVREVEVTVA